ncbi:MAG: hypothetical protein ACXVAY_00500 [Mucilaginibacter sp.]
MKILLLAAALTAFFVQTTNKLNLNDLDGLTNKKWTGTLTYLDYGTGKLTPIAAQISVKKSPKGAGVYTWSTEYPNEPGHGSVDEVVISNDGSVLDGETVKERAVMPDGSLKITTVKTGNDNNKKATFVFTYLIGKTKFTRKKEVCYDGQTNYFMRNELSVTSY